MLGVSIMKKLWSTSNYLLGKANNMHTFKPTSWSPSLLPYRFMTDLAESELNISVAANENEMSYRCMLMKKVRLAVVAPVMWL